MSTSTVPKKRVPQISTLQYDASEDEWRNWKFVFKQFQSSFLSEYTEVEGFAYLCAALGPAIQIIRDHESKSFYLNYFAVFMNWKFVLTCWSFYCCFFCFIIDAIHGNSIVMSVFYVLDIIAC